MIRKVVFGLLILTLVGCSGYLALREDPKSRLGTTPVVEGNPDLAEVVDPALQVLTENAPQNPADLTGWLAAAGLATATLGAAVAKKYLPTKKSK